MKLAFKKSLYAQRPTDKARVVSPCVSPGALDHIRRLENDRNEADAARAKRKAEVDAAKAQRMEEAAPEMYHILCFVIGGTPTWWKLPEDQKAEIKAVLAKVDGR